MRDHGDDDAWDDVDEQCGATRIVVSVDTTTGEESSFTLRCNLRAGHPPGCQFPGD